MSESRLILYMVLTLLLVIHTGDVIASSADLWRKIVLALGTVGFAALTYGAYRKYKEQDKVADKLNL